MSLSGPVEHGIDVREHFGRTEVSMGIGKADHGKSHGLGGMKRRPVIGQFVSTRREGAFLGSRSMDTVYLCQNLDKVRSVIRMPSFLSQKHLPVRTNSVKFNKTCRINDCVLGVA